MPVRGVVFRVFGRVHVDDLRRAGQVGWPAVLRQADLVHEAEVLATLVDRRAYRALHLALVVGWLVVVLAVAEVVRMVRLQAAERAQDAQVDPMPEPRAEARADEHPDRDGTGREGVDAAAHFSCVGATRDKVRQELAQLKSMAVKRLVALRGDLPSRDSTRTETSSQFESQGSRASSGNW